MATHAIDRRTREATLVFLARIQYQEKTDAELRLLIKTLREMLLGRQQSRHAAKMLKQFPAKS